ncbi:MAG: hypothetical protein HYX76_11550 [Acidobacteria bacterium]|nr:hypothetical protein [Acidobacteriota bacterium]
MLQAEVRTARPLAAILFLLFPHTEDAAIRVLEERHLADARNINPVHDNLAARFLGFPRVGVEVVDVDVEAQLAWLGALLGLGTGRRPTPYRQIRGARNVAED